MKDCLSIKKFHDLIAEAALKNDTVCSATIELLDICNFKCSHCYIKDCYHYFMSYDKFCSIVDELKQAGCIWLLLTGGEITKHPEFKKMYLYAYHSGMRITLFTNGSFNDDSILDMLTKYPPELVEITLYGYDELSYCGVTKSSGNFYRVLYNITTLRNREINLSLKCVITKDVLPYFDKIERLADELHIPFRFDGFILPRADGNCECQNQRLSPDEVFKFDKKRKNIEARIKESYKKATQSTNLLYSCGAGKNSLFIDARAMMYICMMSRNIVYDLNSECSSIEKGRKFFKQEMTKLRPLMPNDQCFNCKLRPICRYCPGEFVAETNSLYVPSPWHCQYTHLLYNEYEKS